MTRSLSGATASGISDPVTRPGYFIFIAFASAVYYSTRGTLDWNEHTWIAADIEVSGLAFDALDSAQSGSLVIGNADGVIGALILGEGVAGRAISIWAFYGDADPATADPVQLFSGVGDTASLDDKGRATIGIVRPESTTLYTPRRYITAAEGFHWLPPDGMQVTWGGETVILTREPL